MIDVDRTDGSNKQDLQATFVDKDLQDLEYNTPEQLLSDEYLSRDSSSTITPTSMARVRQELHDRKLNQRGV